MGMDIRYAVKAISGERRKQPVCFELTRGGGLQIVRIAGFYSVVRQYKLEV